MVAMKLNVQEMQQRKAIYIGTCPKQFAKPVGKLAHWHNASFSDMSDPQKFKIYV